MTGRFPLRPALLAVAAWTVLLLLFATQYYVAFRAAGQPVTWVSQLRRELPGWALWAALSPLVYLTAQRLPLIGDPRRWRNALLHVPIAAGLFLLHLLLYNIVIDVLPLRPDVAAAGMSFQERMVQSLQMNFATFCLIYLGVSAASYMLAYQRQLKQQEVRAAQLQGNLTQARLDSLRMQLQPHFLFNTLHGISALMEREPRTARRMIAKLSDLLRFSIDENDELVPLEKELTLLSRYLEIQGMRFGDRLTWRLDVPDECLAARVPRFLLQPLVENAIQHGLGGRAEPGTLVVTGRCGGQRLTLHVDDDGVGAPPPSELVEGVGLTNSRARLQALYGEDASLRLVPSPLGGTRAELVLPYGGENV